MVVNAGGHTDGDYARVAPWFWWQSLGGGARFRERGSGKFAPGFSL